MEQNIFLLKGKKFIKDLLIHLGVAKYKIWILNFAFDRKIEDTPEGSDLIAIFEDAPKRNIDLRIITNNKKSFESLIRITPEVKLYPGNESMHAKVILIDDDTIFIGSHNLTYNSLFNNYEISLKIRNRELNKKLSEEFLQLWQFSKLQKKNSHS